LTIGKFARVSQVLPGCATLTTTPMDTHVGQERMEKVVAR
jgi:site-specific recombinase XerD